VTSGISSNLEKPIKKLGIKKKKAALAIGFRVIAMQLGLHRDDFLLMNTVAIYDNYRNFVIHTLEKGRLAHAYWFIHEDLAQLKIVGQELINNKSLHNRIRKLIEQNKLTILVPSARVCREYNKFFNTTKVITIPLRVEVPQIYTSERKPSDYREINFLLSGPSSDGRKGQLLVLAAFQKFIDKYHYKNPSGYRDFSLNFLAIDEGYISRQIRWIGESALGKRLIITPPVSHEKALEITSECNAVICCSLSETFGLYVTEAMQMGHVVLRNDSAGVDEQLKDGLNGYKIDHRDVNNISDVIEKILNKKTTSDDDLQKMGVVSQDMARGYAKNNYLNNIEAHTER
jgi:glycosyltransferase involved in cell wall biosynthesis